MSCDFLAANDATNQAKTAVGLGPPARVIRAGDGSGHARAGGCHGSPCAMRGTAAAPTALHAKAPRMAPQNNAKLRNHETAKQCKAAKP